ncbi:tetratricopeptide repeat protein [Streptacidiphilus sp. EB103A]|uniref:tetratricopeptide repeat protein n=1 Tax=Streptacidiphilus sp. EB103A TaxID=3156275 RepID=UPI003512D7E5
MRARVGPGPLRDLKDLLYEVYLAAGSPTLDEIAADIESDDGLSGAPSRDSVHRCLSSPQLPVQQGDAVAVASVLARRAAWDRDDLTIRVRDLWLQVRMARPAGQPIAEYTNPFTLEVHRAIEAAATGEDPLPVLPAYVAREHDERLRQVVTEAADGESRLLVLVGGSSTGKTRACWEAVQKLPRGWRLWHPIDPSRPDAALEEIAAAGPRTVMWLNEAQHYLLTAVDGLGERVAAGLRELLRDPQRAPVLVLGTVWTEYWRILTTPPQPGHPDLHAQARALLTGHELPVPSAFTDDDLVALHERAEGDPRLAHAAERAENRQITQYLAGAPALLERYHTASDAERALIDAAMDARRLGHSPALPHALLEAAAEGYLNDQQWDLLGEDWLEQALAYAVQPLRGARGPLTRIRPRRGEPKPNQPHYRLADYLVQHSREHRRTTPIPAALWDALLDYAPLAERTALAQAAQTRGLMRLAIRFYTDAAAAGDIDALGRAGALLGEAGRVDEALTWYERAADSGDAFALKRAGDLLRAARRSREAITWYERAADAGNAFASRWAAGLVHDAVPTSQVVHQVTGAGKTASRAEEAIEWLQDRAETGDTVALMQVIDLLHEAGRSEEAIGWLQDRAEAGDTVALVRAADLLEEAGRLDEAIGWLHGRVDSGDAVALVRVADLLEEAGRLDEALDCFERAADAGDTLALVRAAELLEEADRLEEALDWYDRAADAGFAFALRAGAVLLRQAGMPERAITWYRRAAETGDTVALLRAADLLRQTRHHDEALTCYQRAADAGNAEALLRGAQLLEHDNRAEEAIDWLQARAATDLGDTMAQAAALLAAEGHVEKAIAWYQYAADSGHALAVKKAAQLLKQTGRTEEAAGLQDRTAASTPLPRRQPVSLLQSEGGHEKAIAWARRAAGAGDSDSLRRVVWLLRDAGRGIEAEQLSRYGWEADGTITESWNAAPPNTGPIEREA